MRVLFLGATRGMGRALASLLAQRGEQLFLIGRDAEQLALSAKDFELRGSEGPVGTAPCDLLNPEGFEAALEAAWETMGGIDVAVITAALFAPGDELLDDDSRTRELLQANFVSTIELCERLRRRMLAAGGGTLCVFSSVAGDRGRKPVILYGASKAGLSYYLEALDHRYRAQGLRVVCVKPGFVHTAMTAGLSPPPFAGEPDQVASRVLRAIDAGAPVVYAPAIWRWVMLVIKFLPRFIMRRVGF